MKKILLLTDFSDGALAAAKYAKKLASCMGAKLVVLHVFNPEAPNVPSHYYKNPHLSSWIEEHNNELEEKAQQELQDLENFCKEANIQCEKHLRKGIPAEEIVNFINNGEGIDHVIMGRHGFTNWQARSIGTNTDYIIRNISCSVTLVSENDCS